VSAYRPGRDRGPGQAPPPRRASRAVARRSGPRATQTRHYQACLIMPIEEGVSAHALWRSAGARQKARVTLLPDMILSLTGLRPSAGARQRRGSPLLAYLAQHRLVPKRREFGGHVPPSGFGSCRRHAFMHKSPLAPTRSPHRAALLPSDSNRSKYPIVCRNPSLSGTVGSHPRCSRAMVMFGWRCLGSSCGSGR
jgi:hypothetical protein